MTGQSRERRLNMHSPCRAITESPHDEDDFSEDEYDVSTVGLTSCECQTLEAKGMVLKPLTWEDFCEMQWEETYVYAGNPPWSMDAIRKENEEYWEEVHRRLAEEVEGLTVTE